LAAGQFFTTFRRDVHVISDFDQAEPGPHFEERAAEKAASGGSNTQSRVWDDSRAVEWFAAMDYGFAHYTVFLLGCTDGDGNVFVVDEHAERLWLPQRHAAAVRAMLGRHGLKLQDLKRIVAGADVFSRQSDGTTIAQQYAREGIKLRPATTDRVNGWAEVLQRLGSQAEGNLPEVRARLFIHQRCGRLAETLPAMQHDPNRPEDVLKVDADEDGVGGDDAADALRYLVATKARTVVERKLVGV
jgi:hypothetical protein